jgi:hypothetical protein
MIQNEQSKYLPPEFDGLYIGMNLEEFQNLRQVADMELDINDLVSYYTHYIEHPYIAYFVYQFDHHNLLYEMIIEFKDGYDLYAHLKKLYGNPNKGDEWLFKVNHQLYLKVWKFMNSFCIADMSYFD